MSNTPRTDAACFAVVSNDPQSVVVWADFARQLERDNAALRSLLREAITDHVSPYDLPESEDFIERVKNVLGDTQ